MGEMGAEYKMDASNFVYKKGAGDKIALCESNGSGEGHCSRIPLPKVPSLLTEVYVI